MGSLKGIGQLIMDIYMHMSSSDLENGADQIKNESLV